MEMFKLRDLKKKKKKTSISSSQVSTEITLQSAYLLSIQIWIMKHSL